LQLRAAAQDALAAPERRSRDPRSPNFQTETPPSPALTAKRLQRRTAAARRSTPRADHKPTYATAAAPWFR
jgi:hypothetical protein